MTPRNRIAAIVASILFFVLVGTTTATALWSTTATVGGSVKVATVSASCGSTAMINASFEDPILPGTLGYAEDGDMPGWRAKDAAGNPVRIEIWRGYDNVAAGTGNQHVELNADVPGTLFQTLDSVPGDTLQWSLMHRGRGGTDTMQLLIGAENAAGVSQGNFSDDNTSWRRYSGAYVVPAGQTRTTLAFKAVSAAGGDSIGNFLDDVSFGSGPCLANNTTVANITNPSGVYRAGDTVEFTSVVTNSGSSFSLGTIYEAVLPTGVTYAPGTMTINALGRTDVIDTDPANWVAADRKVIARIGTGATASAGGTIAQNTQTITVKYRAVITAAAAGTTISLTPQVSYANGLASAWGILATSNTVSFPVSYGADLAVTVTGPTSNVQRPSTPNTVATAWTVQVTNNGPLPSGAGANVTITIPATGDATTTAPATTTGASCLPISGGQSVCTITNAMAVGATRTFTFTRQVANSVTFNTVLTVSATATSSVADAVPGNNTGSDTVTVVDTAVPSTPGAPTVTTTATTAAVSWTASNDASGIAGYDLYRNGVLILPQLGNVTSFNDTGLTPWATYTYRVVARDNAGLVSATSATTTTVTTPGTLNTTGTFRISRTTTDYVWWGDDYCFSASGNTNGATLGMSTTCTSSVNLRDWRFTPSTTAGFVKLETGSSDRFWTAGATGTGTTILSGTTASSQDWIVTAVSGGYTFESRSRAGLCLEQTSAGALSLLTCDGTAQQRFAVAAR